MADSRPVGSSPDHIYGILWEAFQLSNFQLGVRNEDPVVRHEESGVGIEEPRKSFLFEPFVFSLVTNSAIDVRTPRLTSILRD